MRLHSNDTSDDQPLDETDERAVDNTAVDNAAVDNTAVDNTAVDNTADGDSTDGDTGVHPTFTPAARQAPDDEYAGDEVAGDVPDGVAAQTPTVAEPAAGYSTVETVEPAGDYAGTAAAVPAAAPADLDQPLLSGDTELLSQWQRVQAEFVDDPQVAVAGAADLVEQAGQALVEALQQRQRQMRTLWDHSSADRSAAPGDSPDTEQLRQMMQRYRALFNQLHQPA